MATSNAVAVWEGKLRDGKGSFKAQSGAFSGSFSFGTRFEGKKGSNPEELLAAAHAGCFSMALSAALEKAGAPVELHVFEDAIHAFVQMPMLDMAGEAIAKLFAFARQRVSQGAAPVRDRGRT